MRNKPHWAQSDAALEQRIRDGLSGASNGLCRKRSVNRRRFDPKGICNGGPEDPLQLPHKGGGTSQGVIMNKKSIIRMLLVLALPLYGGVGGGLLSSCKTKRAVTEKSDSVAIHNVCLSDSIRSDVSFVFDEFDVFVYDSLDVDSVAPNQRLHLVKHICISNGRIEQTNQEIKKKQVCDTLNVSSEKHTTPLSPPPKPNCWFIIGMIIGLIIIIIASRTRS